MSRKVISIYTLLAFIIFSISCYSTSTKKVRKAANWYGKEAKIFSVVKTTGEYIEFSKEKPGRISGNKITGTSIILSKKTSMERADIKKIRKHSDGRIFEVIDKEGKIYHVVGTAREEEDKFILFTTYASSESVSIPLSEVKSLKIKRINLLLTALVIALSPIGIFIGGALGFIE